MTNSTDATLDEREKTYGRFTDNATIAQSIKQAFRKQYQSKWDDLANDQKETLDLIATKIGRILSGDPNHADSWHDIAGYARLVERRLIVQCAPIPDYVSHTHAFDDEGGIMCVVSGCSFRKPLGLSVSSHTHFFSNDGGMCGFPGCTVTTRDIKP